MCKLLIGISKKKLQSQRHTGEEASDADNLTLADEKLNVSIQKQQVNKSIKPY